MTELRLTLNFDPKSTKKYAEILTTLHSLQSLGFTAHEGIGVRVYVNCNEAKKRNPWFQDDDMHYMENIKDGLFSLALDVKKTEGFQYRYLVIYDVPLFRKIGSTWRHLYSLINVSELENHMPTYFGNRILPCSFKGGEHIDDFNVPTVLSQKGACRFPFVSLIAADDGRMTVCCVDDNFLLNVGNLNDPGGYSAVFKGQKMQELRRAHLEGNFQNTPINHEGVPLCLLCQEWHTSRVHPDELTTITDETELHKLENEYRQRIDLSDPELRDQITPYLTFELSSRCDLSCTYCSQKNPSLAEHGDMKLKDFCHFLDSLQGTKNHFENINLFFRGESLLHPEFPKFIARILEDEPPIFTFLVLHTNALALDEPRRTALLDAFSQRRLPACGNLVVSIDAATEKTYHKLRGGKLQVAEENIIEFIRERNLHQQFGPNLILQFIVLPENQHEAGEFLAKWKEILQRESTKPFRVCATLANQPPRIDSDILYFRVDASPGGGDPAVRIARAKENYLQVVTRLGLKVEK